MNTLFQLEFEKILNLISSICHSEPAKEKILKIRPFSDAVVIRQQLRLVSQLQQMLINGVSFNFEGIIDISLILESFRYNCFSFEEFKSLFYVISISNRMSRIAQDWEDFTEFLSLIDSVTELPYHEKRFLEIFTPDGKINDNASPELRSIRNRQKHVRQSIIKTLNTKLDEQIFSSFIQEKIITERDGRYVLPIKDGSAKFVNGISHGKSSSKSSVYMEPQEIIELNNENDYLKEEEREEIYRILSAFSEDIIKVKEQLIRNYKQIVLIDLNFAIATFSNKIEAGCPEITEKPYLKLLRAKHPLLMIKFGDNDKVIPFDLELGEDFKILLISGPNTGGKTVTLKSIGLITLMALSGLPVPVAENSVIGLFPQVIADIGDNQSLEDSLSTFSSHVKNLQRMLEKGDSNTLILVDEIGSATDPEQGSALAQAILERFVCNKVTAVLTTHYTALKIFAEQNQYCVNASMHFDSEVHKPTYQFKIGLPGNSFAIEVAHQLGLDESLIERAKELSGKQNVELTDLLKKITEEKKILSRREYEFKLKQKNLEQKIREYENRIDEIKTEQKDIRKKALKDAKEYIIGLQKKINQEFEIIKKEKKEIKEKKIKDISKKIVNISEKIDKEEDEFADERKPLDNPEIGKIVWIKNLQGTGEIIEISRDSIKVNMDGFVYVTSKDNLFETNSVKPTFSVKTTKHVSEKSYSTELKILGLTFEESLPLLNEFIDDAFYYGLGKVRIVHGKGTGALRKKVTDFLRHHPRVSDYYSPVSEAGGDGVTVAEIKL
ncbi:MAG: endonuclease MutS2 [Candidatus Cloacimonetes bacterium]|nr:endonuclease MutS2 [Candidatus Cloacimonadota bacterium]